MKTTETAPFAIRDETPGDVSAIFAVEAQAFRDNPYGQGREPYIVDALRDAGALALSLVATTGTRVVGHIAFSSAVVGKATSGWYILGPVAVMPDRQGRGIGSALVSAGLDRLRLWGADGCVLVGDPGYYSRFGFVHVRGVSYEGVPDEFVLCLPLSGAAPKGVITAHRAFSMETDG
jgi:putative acetyltransferase